MSEIEYTTNYTKKEVSIIKDICTVEELDFIGFDDNTKNIHYFARYKNKLIGCSRIRIYTTSTFELCTVWVDKNFRSKGVAKNMINHLISEIKDDIYLITDFENTKYYLQFGFNISDNIPDIMKDKFNFCVNSYPHYKIYLMLRKKS